ncbi:MAG: TonB-dependent receptor [Gammaproteobacteria bacterium]|nr:TonB-dependent receptor [Gammaproteobacteria bacterium]
MDKVATREQVVATGSTHADGGRQRNNLDTKQVLVAVFVFIFCSVGTNASEPVYELDIPSQNAATALHVLAEQTGAITLFPFDMAQAHQANAVVGSLTLQQALDVLLANTGLTGGLSEKRVISLTEVATAPRQTKGEPMGIKKTGLATLLAAILSAAPSVAEEGQQENRLEEIVVTAQKREQSLQDVGLAITAFDEQSVADRWLDEPYQLADTVPNLQAFDNAVGQTHFRIRGLGLNEFQVSFDSPVAINVDEVILSKPFMASMGFYDVQRIEVLKGPQGTIFGRNTTGGAVNYYNNTPTREFEAGARGTYNVEYERYELDVFASGPLTDNLSARLSVSGAYANDDAGPYLNLFDGKQIGTKDNKKQVRGQLLWENDTTRVLGSVHFGTQKGDSIPYDNLFQDIPGGAQAGGVTDPTAVIRNPIGRFVVNQDFAPKKDFESRGASLRIDHNFGEFTFTSLTGYEFFERDAREDSDNTPVDTVNIDWYSDIDQFSQEFRLAGDFGEWNFLFGAYYETDEMSSVNTISITSLGLGLNTGGSDYAQDTDTWALFTNHEYAFTEQLSLIAGLRYTEEKNQFTGLSFAAFGFAGPGPKNRVDPSTYIPGLVSADVSRTDTDLNFKIGLNYQPNDDILLFTSYSTGFRSGGFDAGLFAESLIIFEPEDVTAFEAGIKTTLLDSTLIANLAVFFTEVDNYQENANLPTELVPRRRNIGTLETKGVEVDLNWLPTDRWLIRASAGYANAEIVDSDFVFGTIAAEGNVPANSPEFSTNFYVSYFVPITTELNFEISANWSWVDERFLEVENQPDHLVDSYSTIDASIAIGAASGKWRASLWGRNLGDDIHVTYVNDVPGFGLFLPINSDPMTYGLTLQVNM